jgi:hypothetical protein
MARGVQLDAVRRYCMQCTFDQPNEIRLCPSTRCPLHSFRFAKNQSNPRITTINAIHARCLDCQGGETKGKAVVMCKDEDCALWPFRTGHRPKAGTLSTDNDE